MPYLDIVFQNINMNPNIINDNVPYNSRNYYTTFPNRTNVYSALVPGQNGNPPSAGWGNSITGNTACGIFFSEAHPYQGHYNGWRQGNSAVPNWPILNQGWVPSGFIPGNARLCAFLEGGQGQFAGVAIWNYLFGRNSIGTQELCCLGTGAALFRNGLALWGSDRYGIAFTAVYRSYPVFQPEQPILGLFVHIQNNAADPGSQIVALCKPFRNFIIFGDLNLNLHDGLKFDSLEYAVSETHQILAIREGVNNHLYSTRYSQYENGNNSCLDFVLVPHQYINYVELWAYRLGAIPKLETNGSDHSIMMLRIRCA